MAELQAVNPTADATELISAICGDANWLQEVEYSLVFRFALTSPFALVIQSIRFDHATSGWLHLFQRGNRLVNSPKEKNSNSNNNNKMMIIAFLVCFTLVILSSTLKSMYLYLHFLLCVYIM